MWGRMAGYWPSSSLCVYGPTETQSRSLTRNKTRPISSHLDQTGSVNKGFTIKGHFYSREIRHTSRDLEREDSLIRPITKMGWPWSDNSHI